MHQRATNALAIGRKAHGRVWAGATALGIGIKPKRAAPDSVHHLDKECRRKGTARELVGDIGLAVLEAHCRQPLGEFLVADIPPGEFRLQDALGALLSFFRRFSHHLFCEEHH